MAAQEKLQDPQEPTKYNKKCILKVSIHCEGCKKKVKKILNRVQGVDDIDIDIKQHKVTVTGDVDANTLLRKLIKSGKHAELWPEKAEPKEKKTSSKSKEKEKLTEQETSNQEHSQGSVNDIKTASVKEVKPPPVKVEAVAQEPTKNSKGGGAKDANDGGAAKSGEENNDDGGGGAAEVTASSEGGAKKTESGGDQAVEELKTDEKKPEGGGSGGAHPPPPPEEKKGGESAKNSPVVENVSGGGNDGDGNGKKKKKNGQNGNLTGGEQSSAAQEAMRWGNHDDGPPAVSVSDHHSHRHYRSFDQYGPQFYGPPGPPPIYAVSYNTANPASSYTASFYAPPQPNSYVYSYSGGPEMQAPPSDFDAYPRQPLDSFEIFSDENPNGCSIM